jgi:hypothetical protein
MCYGNNDDPGLAGAIEYVERESLQNELVGSVLGQRVASRSFHDSGDGIINGVGECCGA